MFWTVRETYRYLGTSTGTGTGMTVIDCPGRHGSTVVYTAQFASIQLSTAVYYPSTTAHTGQITITINIVVVVVVSPMYPTIHIPSH